MPRSTLNPTDCAARTRAAVFHLARRLRASLQGEDGSVAKLSVLGHLHRSGPLSPTELAAREGVRLQSLTRLLAELGAEGWVERRASETDRRQSVLSLTRAGAQQLQAGVRAGEAPLAQAIEACLDAREREVLMEACELMSRLAQAMGEGQHE